MKRLTCEICGSTDLIKQDGVFVCQSCGLKYSVEEAKKMMIEGTVDIKGTVQIDNSISVQKYLANARRAKEKEDWEEVEKYYNMVEQNDPDNIEAIFYSAYGKAMQSLIENDIYKRSAVFKVLTNCISIIDDHYQINRREENKVAINNMADDLGEMVCSSFVYTASKNSLGITLATNKNETFAIFRHLLSGFKEMIDNIEKIDDQPYLHEASIRFYKKARGLKFDGLLGFLENNLLGSWESDIDKWIREEEEELINLNKTIEEIYFKEHHDETKLVDEEIASLNDKKKAINGAIISKLEGIRNIPEQVELEALKSENMDIRKDLDYIGPFQRKKEKALTAKLDENCKRINELENIIQSISKPFEDEIANLRKQVKEINARLTDLKENKYEIVQKIYLTRNK